ncbi:hypothetical protein PoB_002675100 [Plakobranchus ocellatus]|uniref:Pleiotrophin/Midkine C-terminal domain-containing protein n=1 Tax=Plakobranchus ocellatus TaxID=259542 RepID=A0AAV3ZWF0_9GAST|nr:hypothetical protein PoB_002675100 [Plakobranchus ocellatus]
MKQVHKYVRICQTKRSKSHRSWISLYLYGEKTHCDRSSECDKLAVNQSDETGRRKCTEDYDECGRVNLTRSNKNVNNGG